METPRTAPVNGNQVARRQSQRVLLLALGITGTFLLAEVVGGILTGSLALLADAGHMLTDVVATGMAVVAAWFAIRPPTMRHSWGYYRAEVLAALANGLLLLGVVGYIVFEALHRLRHPPPVLGGPMLGIALVGLLANLTVALLLARQSQRTINVQGVLLHVLGDALGSVGVLTAGVLILWKGWHLADPIASLAIAAILVVSVVRLLRTTTDILLEAVPTHIDLQRVRESLLRLPGVVGVHDLHVWTLSTGFVAMSGHLVVERGDSKDLLVQVREHLKHQFGIDHATIQVETPDFPEEPVHCVGDPRCLP
ncbi:MAG: cation diffusion facilitator family transporter [Dehalococcoidia bacterium]|nr:cation diffusion facilitator family transporter [Dehalococcoidia bacterium]MDW8119853.1 cation diffusion facilitator family transporter [Chloroflexota bacterium]